MATGVCATCGASVGEDALFSDKGEPICVACSARADVDREEGRASQAIFASSGAALALGVIAFFADPCFVTTIAAVASGAGTLNLLAKHPEHRARLGAKTFVAAGAAIAGMLLSIVAPFASVLVQTLWVAHQDAEIVAPVAHDESEDAEEEAVLDPRRVVFDTALPAWVIALDARSAGREHAAPGDVASTHAQVLAAVDRTMPALHDAFARFLDDAEAFSLLDNDTDDAALTDRMVLLDAALADADAPYYVDTILLRGRDRHRVLASTYDVARARHFASGERRVTSLDLRRIDTLSFEQSLLGYTRPEVRYALVLVAPVEEFSIGRALPSIHSADESVIVRGYEHETNVAWITPFEVAVHEDLRREAAGAMTAAGLHERNLIDLAAAIVNRRAALDVLSHEISHDGSAIAEPTTFAYDVRPLRAYARRVTTYALGDVNRAQQALESDRMRATYAALEGAMLASIARHEAQHRIDYEDDRIVHVPDALAAYTGRTESEDQVNHLAERSNAELSAYLSQIAREPARALTNLVYVLQFAMSRSEWGSPECYAAVVIAESLGRELGVSERALIADREIDRAAIAGIYSAARAHTGDEVAAAASRAWTALYGAPLPPLEAVAD